jgi:hypothetical protein
MMVYDFLSQERQQAREAGAAETQQESGKRNYFRINMFSIEQRGIVKNSGELTTQTHRQQ